MRSQEGQRDLRDKHLQLETQPVPRMLETFQWKVTWKELCCIKQLGAADPDNISIYAQVLTPARFEQERRAELTVPAPPLPHSATDNGHPLQHHSRHTSYHRC